MSVSKITDKGNIVLFTHGEAKVLDQENQTILTAKREGDLYIVSESTKSESGCIAKSNRNFREYHRLMGHLNLCSLKEAITNKHVQAAEVKFKDFECDVCLRTKMTRSRFEKTAERSSELLEIIHCDVCQNS